MIRQPYIIEIAEHNIEISCYDNNIINAFSAINSPPSKFSSSSSVILS